MCYWRTGDARNATKISYSLEWWTTETQTLLRGLRIPVSRSPVLPPVVRDLILLTAQSHQSHVSQLVCHRLPNRTFPFNPNCTLLFNRPKRPLNAILNVIANQENGSNQELVENSMLYSMRQNVFPINSRSTGRPFPFSPHSSPVHAPFKPRSLPVQLPFKPHLL